MSSAGENLSGRQPVVHVIWAENFEIFENFQNPPESVQEHLYIWKLSQKLDFDDLEVSKSTDFEIFWKLEKKKKPKVQEMRPGTPPK